MNVAIIPARKNSKRIAGKNKRLFLGKPIIEYAIESAEKATIFDQIIISTDDIEMGEKYKPRCGVLGRSKETSSDLATLTEVLQEALLQLEDVGIYPEAVCLILPCAVFVDYNDLLMSYEDLNYNDAVMSVCRFGSHPLRTLGYTNHKFGMLIPENANLRTQDLPDAFYDAGQFYWINVKSFRKQGKIFMDNLVPYMVEAVDIDTEQDWNLAEAIIGNK